MTYTIQGGAVQTRSTKLTTTVATEIATGGTSGAIVVAVYAAEIAGATPTFSYYKTDGVTNYFLRSALAMTARQEYTRDVIIVLKANEQIMAIAGTANQIDVNVTYIPGDRTAKGSVL